MATAPHDSSVLHSVVQSPSPSTTSDAASTSTSLPAPPPPPTFSVSMPGGPPQEPGQFVQIPVAQPSQLQQTAQPSQSQTFHLDQVAQPLQFSQQAQTAQPAQPVQPVQPAQFSQPISTSQPDQFVQPSQSAQLSQPMQTAQPVQFVQPSQSAQFSQTMQTAQPVHMAQSAQQLIQSGQSTMPSQAASPQTQQSSTQVQTAVPTIIDFRVKWIIDEYNRSIPICMQNNNGPCALLALANACFLLLDMTMTPGITRISEQALMSMLAEYVSGNADKFNDNGDPELRAARLFAVDDFIDLLPSLNKGMDVNVRFDSPVSFEFTRELSIFDVFPNIRLVHGWLVDPQDATLMAALGCMTYNQLVDELVRTAHQSVDLWTVPDAPPADEFGPFSPPPPPEELGLPGMAPPSHFDQIGQGLYQSNGFDDSGNHYYDGSSFKPPKKAPHEALTDQMNNMSSKLDQEYPYAEQPNIQHNAEVSDSDIHVPANNAQNDRESPDTVMIRELRPQVVDFIESNPTQLTVYGLMELHSILTDGEVAILFRNSHFHVLRKRQDAIYTLVTDEGYLNQLNTVWEKLADVTGDSTFYNGAFQQLQADGTVQVQQVPPKQPSRINNSGTTSAGAAGTSQQGPVAAQGWSGKKKKGKKSEGGCKIQ